uniref:Putative Secretion protein HlyD n=1 Tax=mine drainage metagenome TaxID=410659 RepID=E6QLK9_9ZZZZ
MSEELVHDAPQASEDNAGNAPAPAIAKVSKSGAERADEPPANVEDKAPEAPELPATDYFASPAEIAPLRGGASHIRRAWPYLLAGVVIIAAVVFLGVLPRLKLKKETAARAVAAKDALPVVDVAIVRRSSAVQQLTLPGTVTPSISVHIFGQASGYLKARYVDIGDRVHRGQLLAVISSPDLDAIVIQQRSLVQESKDFLKRERTQESLARVTYDRIHVLAVDGVLSQQDNDVALAALLAASANVQSAQNAVGAANGSLQHATSMAAFEEVRSPIDGTVTARNVEVGSFISAIGAGQGNGPAPAAGSGAPPTGGAQGGELFEVADLRDLHVFVAVPEQDAIYMGTGPKAVLIFSEMPGERFDAKIIRSTDSLSQQTRTLLMEMKVADPKHRLRPGMYATVQLGFDALDPGILVSGSSLITLANGVFVAVVKDNVIHMHKVQMGRDLGTEVYVTTGLNDGDAVVLNPTDAVQDGVHVVAKATPKGVER